MCVSTAINDWVYFTDEFSDPNKPQRYLAQTEEIGYLKGID